MYKLEFCSIGHLEKVTWDNNSHNHLNIALQSSVVCISVCVKTSQCVWWERVEVSLFVFLLIHQQYLRHPCLASEIN